MNIVLKEFKYFYVNKEKRTKLINCCSKKNKRQIKYIYYLIREYTYVSTNTSSLVSDIDFSSNIVIRKESKMRLKNNWILLILMLSYTKNYRKF